MFHKISQHLEICQNDAGACIFFDSRLIWWNRALFRVWYITSITVHRCKTYPSVSLYVNTKHIDLAKPKSEVSIFWLVLIICENTWTCDPMKIHSPVSGKVKKNHVTSVSYTLEPVILSCGTGQRIPYFDTCQLFMKSISHIKLQRCTRKPWVDPSWPVYFVWAPSCVTPSSNKHPPHPHCSHIKAVQYSFFWTIPNFFIWPFINLPNLGSMWTLQSRLALDWNLMGCDFWENWYNHNDGA